ncbi:DUF943 family protein [Brenneria goodwinii]|uniref:DUF943 family protein n=1 Tax=Brenneria goodwinii TaxID=1109412 RepID=UPI000EF2219C|nr:DUF943 family protein [Brenneria goodwinii]MCG8157682.1 DUF943 family protein [Brenneria goodwinii]MCG8161077.1 DUF943 family protein [Brenneria goodwinii]MCG8165505.1 DUF943 family protein [Brenneria goodwinii]MCG8169988.1 DUF943 family protein [Brenneria goodwinii]MCG8176793.1 DUF943 family protein [Brenneria goodwinii]
MFKKYRLMVAGVVIISMVLYVVWIIIRPVEIVRVNNTSIYVKYFPSNTQSKIDWWNKNKNSIQQKYNVIRNSHDLDIFIMNFGGYEEIPTGSRDNNIDDYQCFDDVKSKKKCILNDIAMVIRGDVDKNVYFTFDGKTYIQRSDGEIILKKDNVSVY